MQATMKSRKNVCLRFADRNKTLAMKLMLVLEGCTKKEVQFTDADIRLLATDVILFSIFFTSFFRLSAMILATLAR